METINLALGEPVGKRCQLFPCQIKELYRYPASYRYQSGRITGWPDNRLPGYPVNQYPVNPDFYALFLSHFSFYAY